MNRVTKHSVIIATILLFATAQAATTNINSHTITTTHGFYEGRVSIGTLANMSGTQLLVENNTILGALQVNDTADFLGNVNISTNAYFNGPILLNSTLNSVSDITITAIGSVTRTLLLDGGTDGNPLFDFRANTATRTPGFILRDGSTTIGRLLLDRTDTPVFTGATRNDFVMGTVTTEPVSFATDSTVRLQITSDGALDIVASSLTTCDSSHRGEFRFVEGGIGVADTLQFCGKSALDIYAWRSVTYT